MPERAAGDEGDLAAMVARLEALAARIRDSDELEPDALGRLAEEAAELAARVAAGVAEELGGEARRA